MSTRILRHAITLLALAAAMVALAPAQNGSFAISCEGTESNGGGTTRYQYTLRNNGSIPQTLTLFYLGTQDLIPTNYSSWSAPPGFPPVAVVANWPTLLGMFPVSVASTTQTKTPHGVPTPLPTMATAGGIVWSGATPVLPGQTVTFAFDNVHFAWDMEWFADHPTGAAFSQGFPGLPIAGPLGTFTNGFVHGPSNESFQTICDPAAPHSGGQYAKITATGNTSTTFPVTHLECIQGPPLQFGYFLVSATYVAPGIPVGSGFLCLGNPIGRYNLVGTIRNSLGRFDNAGVLQNLVGTSSVGSGYDVPAVLPNPPGGAIVSGQMWYFQCWFRDGATSNFSTTVGVSFL